VALSWDLHQTICWKQFSCMRGRMELVSCSAFFLQRWRHGKHWWRHRKQRWRHGKHWLKVESFRFFISSKFSSTLCKWNFRHWKLKSLGRERNIPTFPSNANFSNVKIKNVTRWVCLKTAQMSSSLTGPTHLLRWVVQTDVVFYFMPRAKQQA
jgi:hypothetical protein